MPEVVMGLGPPVDGWKSWGALATRPAARWGWGALSEVWSRGCSAPWTVAFGQAEQIRLILGSPLAGARLRRSRRSRRRTCTSKVPLGRIHLVLSKPSLFGQGDFFLSQHRHTDHLMKSQG